MKYLFILLILFSTSTALAHSGKSLYLLTSSDAKALSGGFQYALTHGQNHQAFEWANPQTGLTGRMIPTKTYQTTFGQVCREYSASVQLDGSIQQAVGMACMQTDGSWKVTGEKQIKRHDSRVRFVYVDPRLKGQLRQSFSHPPLGQEKVNRSVQQKGDFHSDSFHEKLRNYLKHRQPTPENKEVEQKKPSKMIKLVAY